MIAIVLHLAEIFHIIPVLLDNGPVDPYHQLATLLSTIATLVWSKTLFILPKSTQTRLRELPTSVVSRIRGKRLFSLNILIKVTNFQGSMTSGTVTVYIHNECHKLASSLRHDMNHFLNSFFPIV